MIETDLRRSSVDAPESAVAEMPSDELVLDLEQPIQSTPYSIQILLIFGAFVVVVGFTFSQALIGSAVDFVALFITLKSQGMFLRLRTREFDSIWPAYRLGAQEGRNLTEAQREALFRLLVRWPRERAIHIAQLSVIKAVPVSILALFYFDRQFSFPIHVSLFLGLEALMILNFSAMVYFSAHDSITDFLVKIHKRDDWSSTFQKVAGSWNGVRDFQRLETASLFGIALLLVVGIIAVGTGRRWEGEWGRIVATVTLVLVGAGFVAQIVLLQRRVLVGGLVRLFSTLEEVGQTGARRILPLSSWALIAGFEAGVNRLIHSLTTRERETGRLIGMISEESRLRSMGEVSALVVHDLGNPIQMAQFCATSLARCTDAELAKGLQKELQASLDRLSALVLSLRARVEDRGAAQEYINLGVVHSQVCRFLDLNLRKDAFQSENWVSCSPGVSVVGVKVSPVELFQIIENLYRNSAQALMRAKISSPLLGIREVSEIRPGFLAIEFIDNGPGLSEERFEQLTSVAGSEARSKSIENARGMGLMLTRRLVQQYGGDIVWIPRPGDDAKGMAEGGYGTCLRVILPGKVGRNETTFRAQ